MELPLPIPKKPEVVGIRTNSLTIRWKDDDVNGKKAQITHYTVSYKAEDEDEQSWKKLRTNNDVQEWQVTDLKPDRGYHFRVASNNKVRHSHQSPISDIIRTTKDRLMPHKPRLKEPPTHDSVSLAWQMTAGDKSNVTHYTISYTVVDKDTDLDYTAIDQWESYDTKNRECNCTIKNLVPGTSYRFAVSANTDQRKSSPSPVSHLITTKKNTETVVSVEVKELQTLPTQDIHQPSETSNPNSLNKDLCHKPQPGSRGAFASSASQDTVPTRPSMQCIGTTKYPQTVSDQMPTNASNTDKGLSQPSEMADIIKTSTEMIPPIPQKPFHQGPPSHNSLLLAWVVPCDTTHVTDYTLTYREEGTRTWTVRETDNTDTSCTVNNLMPRTSYQFRVASNTQKGKSAPSEISVICTPEQPQLDQTPPKPNKPTALAVSHNTVSLEWGVTGYTTNITHYTVTYKIANEIDSLLMYDVETDSADTRYTIEEQLKPGTPYQFQVASNTARCQSLPSEMSDTIMTHEKPHTKPAENCILPKPNSPTVVGIPSHNSVQLCWEFPDNITHVLHYTISYCKADVKEATWITVESKVTERSYTVEDLEPDTSYRFCVAFNTDEGIGQPSEASDAIWTEKDPHTTDPPKPMKPRADGTPPGTSYQISNSAQEKGPLSEASDVITTKASPHIALNPLRPSKPSLDGIPGHNSVPLKWTVPESAIHVNYMLTYRKTDKKGRWMAVETEGTDCHYTVKDLDPDTSYEFRVASNTDKGQSLPSKTSNAIHTSPQSLHQQSAKEPKPPKVTHERTMPAVPERQIRSPTKFRRRPPINDNCPIVTGVQSAGAYRVELQKISEPIKPERGMPLYQVPLYVTKEVGADRIQILDLGISPALPKPEKVILVVGATGAGKSTLINGLLNYVIGVEWADPFRFRLVHESASFKAQHKSQTQAISIYNIYHHDVHNIPYTLKIIDTPGFGDTQGISKDKLITDCIRNLFRKEDYGVDHIDAIGFVAQSSLARLTPTQKYIFDSILALFGKDIGDNIFLFLTFCDSQMPPVLASTREAKIPFKSYFKFNNSALFAKNDSEENEFDKMFWKMGAMNYQKFLSELGNVEGKSLYLTKETLDERQQLEVSIAGIQQNIEDGLTKLEQIKLEIGIVKQHEADIERNQNFKYTVDEHEMVKVDLEEGKNITNCLTCNRTCHYPCMIPNNEDKSSCYAMDKKGCCTVCLSNCIWNLHRNVPFRIEVKIVQVTKTADDLMKRYKMAKGEKMNAKKLTEQLLESFHTLQIKVLYMLTEVRRSLTRLAEIALRPNPLSTLDYLDMLIGTQKAEAKPGFQAKIDQLESVKSEAITLEQMSADGEDPFGIYRQKGIGDTAYFDAMAADIRKKNPSIMKNLYKKFMN